MRTRLSGWLATIIAVTALAFTSMPGPALAAPAKSPQAFKLTPAQNARAQTMQKKFNDDMAALRANKSLTPAQKQSKAQAMGKAHDADMLAILTPAQRVEVKSERDTQAAFMKAHSAEIAEGKALADKLSKSMTPAQKAKINAIRDQFGKTASPRAQKIMADKSLSQQAKQQKMIKLEHEIDPQIVAVMTPSQKADYQKMQHLQLKLIAESKAAQAKK